ncbi:MAG: inosine/xanthosine triphosphatase [bacterium]|nr:inosine/xanthosine triphosphatase [bacterium]
MNRIKIRIGSKNKAKITAVEEILLDYPHLAAAQIESIEASSGISDQPKTLEETIHGAINRAKNIFRDCHYSIGIESGLMEVPKTKSGYMDVCVCAIYDGNESHLGLSSAWEFPDKKVMDLVVKEGLNLSQAINKAGLTNKQTIGSEEGAIGILTKGRVDRKEYTKQALRMALIHLEQFDFYEYGRHHTSNIA